MSNRRGSGILPRLWAALLAAVALVGVVAVVGMVDLGAVAGLRSSAPAFALLPLPAASERDGAEAAAPSRADPLERRLAAWPGWSLPAPLLVRPEPTGELIWPAWFNGHWQVREEGAAGGEGSGAPLQWQARFRADGRGGTVAERAFNARSLGRAALGDALLSVEEDPAHPNRQLSRLTDDRLLETTVVGRRSLQLDATTFLADELSLQVLHGPGAPRIQRVEVLGRWRRLSDGSIEGEQWQASYGSPEAGLAATAKRPQHLRLRLDPLPPGSDPAS